MWGLEVNKVFFLSAWLIIIVGRKPFQALKIEIENFMSLNSTVVSMSPLVHMSVKKTGVCSEPQIDLWQVRIIRRHIKI